MSGCSGKTALVIPPPPDPGTVVTPENPSENPSDNDAVKRTMEMGLGWNLGNQLDAYEEDPNDADYLIPSETIWGNPEVTQTAIS